VIMAMYTIIGQVNLLVGVIIKQLLNINVGRSLHRRICSNSRKHMLCQLILRIVLNRQGKGMGCHFFALNWHVWIIYHSTFSIQVIVQTKTNPVLKFAQNKARFLRCISRFYLSLRQNFVSFVVGIQSLVVKS
jgi:hypothetical protein